MEQTYELRGQGKKKKKNKKKHGNYKKNPSLTTKNKTIPMSFAAKEKKKKRGLLESKINKHLTQPYKNRLQKVQPGPWLEIAK